VTQEIHYRYRVVFRLRAITYLDDVPVSAEEKVKSGNLHGDDALHREQVHKSHLPYQR
jgi:hypothetical protein